MSRLTTLEALAAEVSTLTPENLKPGRSAQIPTNLVDDIRQTLLSRGVDWRATRRAHVASIAARKAARRAGA